MQGDPPTYVICILYSLAGREIPTTERSFRAKILRTDFAKIEKDYLVKKFRAHDWINVGNRDWCAILTSYVLKVFAQ